MDTKEEEIVKLMVCRLKGHSIHSTPSLNQKWCFTCLINRLLFTPNTNCKCITCEYKTPKPISQREFK